MAILTGPILQDCADYVALRSGTIVSAVKELQRGNGNVIHIFFRGTRADLFEYRRALLEHLAKHVARPNQRFLIELLSQGDHKLEHSLHILNR